MPSPAQNMQLREHESQMTMSHECIGNDKREIAMSLLATRVYANPDKEIYVW